MARVALLGLLDGVLAGHRDHLRHPLDVAAGALVIETFLPADTRTRAWLAAADT